MVASINDTIMIYWTWKHQLKYENIIMHLNVFY